MIGHLETSLSKTINCTGTDNQTIINRKYTKHKITNPNTDKLAHSNNTKTPTIPNFKTVRL